MQVEAYLTFAGQAEEAMKFYARCLGGEIIAIHRFGEMPPGEHPVPEDWKQKAMHVSLQAGSTKLMASDTMPGMPAPQYGGFSVSVNIPKDPARGQQVFDALAAGGQVQMPFGQTFWAAGFGMLVDKYGVPWMVNCEA